MPAMVTGGSSCLARLAWAGAGVLIVASSAAADPVSRIGSLPGQPLSAQPGPQPGVRGVVRARHTASISSDLGVAVLRIGPRLGDSFRKGDNLVTFDCRRQAAELDAATAQHREARLALENATYLNERKAAGRLDVEIARTRADKAAAEAAGLEARLAQCVILAPFDGRVAEIAVEEHEAPQPGRPVITIVDTAEPEIELIAPSHWLAWLETGRAFRFRVDETGEIEEATVIRIGAAVDPVSQSVTVVGRLSKPHPRIAPGMSGAADFGAEGQ